MRTRLKTESSSSTSRTLSAIWPPPGVVPYAALAAREMSRERQAIRRTLELNRALVAQEQFIASVKADFPPRTALAWLRSKLRTLA